MTTAQQTFNFMANRQEIGRDQNLSRAEIAPATDHLCPEHSPRKPPTCEIPTCESLTCESLKLVTPLQDPDASHCLHAAPSNPLRISIDSAQPPKAGTALEGASEEETASTKPASPSALSDQQAVLKKLRAQVGCISTATASEPYATFSTGSTAIDQLLPGGGLRTDTITEWIAEAAGSGAASLSLLAAATHLNSSPSVQGPLVVVSDREHFYPPSAISLGIPSERIVWVRPNKHAELVWSIDQALRCASVAAVWACWGNKLDDRDARRFQLAAETGKTPGLFLRPATTRHRPSFAEIRLHVANGTSSQSGSHDPLHGSGRPLQVTLDRCRGGNLGQSVWIQIREQGDIKTIPDQLEAIAGQSKNAQQPGIGNDEKAALYLASELAHPKTPARRAKRA